MLRCNLHHIRDLGTANVGLRASIDGNRKKIHTLPMAGTSGTIDAGELSSIWASHEEHTLRIMKEELETRVDNKCQILKVPEYFRQPTEEYTPHEWRFGLHNRDENVNMSDSEIAKRAVVVFFGLDEPSKWRRFCDIVSDPKAISMCYGLHKEVNGLLGSRIKQMLAYDALFLAAWIDIDETMPWELKRLVKPELFTSSGGMNFLDTFKAPCFDLIPFDLYKIENQIPFDLIKAIINHVEKLSNPQQDNLEDCTSPTDSEDGQVLPIAYVETWMKIAVEVGMNSFMRITDDFYTGGNEAHTIANSHHILDAAHKVICGVGGMERTSDFSQEDYIHVPSATKLKESGIRIEGVVGPLSDMSYDKKKKCLYMPKMGLYDDTVSVVRNMARYEEYLKLDKCMFHDYVFLMRDLIQTPLDLNHLVKCKVIYNGCGNKGVDRWRALEEHLILTVSSEEHNKMKSDIKERCKLRRHKLWSEFRSLFLSKPWLTLSAVAITFVTLATLIQTYSAVISSNGMKP